MLNRLSLSYDCDEDRLAMLVVTRDGEGTEQHQLLHITRRVCAEWRRDLQVMIDMSAASPETLTSEQRAAASRAHHEAILKIGRGSQQPSTASGQTSLPQGTLVTRVISGRRRRDGAWVVRFVRRGCSSLSLVLSNEAMHGLAEALSRRVIAASWGLPPLPLDRPFPRSMDQVPSNSLH